LTNKSSDLTIFPKLPVDPDIPPRPLPAILSQVKGLAVKDMFSRMAAQGFQDVREGHGCVFGFIDLEQGSRLTDLAERSGLTKQAVGEAVAELERKGYLERVPDPEDGRAKIIKLTQRGVDAALTGRRLVAGLLLRSRLVRCVLVGVFDLRIDLIHLLGGERRRLSRLVGDLRPPRRREAHQQRAEHHHRQRNRSRASCPFGGLARLRG
jgi:DNA-binding MarR family transcriptional regulator